jgi:SAM-dependent methyltransferase
MYNHFISLTKPHADDKVLDMGVTPDTLLPESNYFEKLYPYTGNITMSTIEDASNLEMEFKGAKFIRNEQGKPFPFSEKQFDILFCSAVLEHVGNEEQQKFFVSECLRVARKIYLTTPNKRFPIEFHTYLPFAHYLPQHVHQKILRFFKLDFWAETANLNLVTAKRLLSMLPDSVRNNARLYYNRLLGMATNLILYVEDW